MAGSTVELYRSLLALRKSLRLGHGALASVAGFGPDVVALSNDAKGRERVLLLANLGSEPVALPEGARLIAASNDLVDGLIPTDVAVWATW